jgi:DNA-binding SARP family transcriptional activator
MPVFRSYGYWMYEMHGHVLKRFIDIVRGGELGGLAAWAAELHQSLPQPSSPWTSTDIVNGIIRALLLRGEPMVAAEILAVIPNFPTNMDPAELLLVGLATNDFSYLEACLEQPELLPLMPVLARAAMGIEADPLELSADRLREALEKPILRDEGIVHARAIIDTLVRLDSRFDETREVLAPAIVDVVTRMLGWLAERSLPVPMTALLARYGARLDDTSRARWQSRCDALLKLQRKEEGKAGEKIRVTMFGAITIQRPTEEPERVRGAQLCALLGLMVADRLQETPFSQREIISLAMGSERDQESARKSFNFAVFRLRELLGNPLAIDTSGEAPSLSTDLVEVDFIDASSALQRAQEAFSVGALMRAIPELLAALRISAGEVVYPTLYQEFFEGGREDFEAALRNLVIGLSRGLIREHDYVPAEEILTRAYEAMSDDDEIGELLQQVLVRQGKRARAARIVLPVEA